MIIIKVNLGFKKGKFTMLLNPDFICLFFNETGHNQVKEKKKLVFPIP